MKIRYLEALEKKFDYLPKREVERTLEKILNYLSTSLVKGNRIEIRDFGTFTLRHKKCKSRKETFHWKKN